MPLEHDGAPRFTAEQRDEILSLANRLQAQHEGTVGTDELVRAAEEAGIDPRFVHEAAMRLGQKAKPISPAAKIAFGLFVLQACGFMFVQNPWIGANRAPASHEMWFAVAFAFFLALWGGRSREVRWFSPLAAISAWIAVGIATATFTFFVNGHQIGPWVLPMAAFFAMLQAIAALCGAVAAAGLDRTPEAKAFRLYRG